MYDYTGNDWSHRNNNRKFKEKFGSRTMKIFNSFTIADSYTGNTSHNTGSIAV